MPRHAKPSVAQSAHFQQALLGWYAHSHRTLPWRGTTNPYAIWVAEIMLQQTTVVAVIPYYSRFLERFPTLADLAAAKLEDVLHLWQGLGYYRRARLLHRCAQQVVAQHGGNFPNTEAGLRQLPGIGAYTAAVVAACAYNQPSVVIDGNVLRVVARLCALTQPLTPTHATLRAAAVTLCAGAPPTAYANAIMELGATVCTPTNPRCTECPAQAHCAAWQAGTPTAYPVKLPKAVLPHKHGVAYVLHNPQGQLWLQQRPANGLLGGLWEVPHTGWEPTTTPPHWADISAPEAGIIHHTFTHFKLTLEVRTAQVDRIPADHAFHAGALPPLSTLMRKVLRAGGVQV